MSDSPKSFRFRLRYVLLAAAVIVMLDWLSSHVGGNKSTDTSESTAVVSSSDDVPPAGYEKGLPCDVCDGTGRYTHDVLGRPMKGQQCASCGGKGYNWSKK